MRAHRSVLPGNFADYIPSTCASARHDSEGPAGSPAGTLDFFQLSESCEVRGLQPHIRLRMRASQPRVNWVQQRKLHNHDIACRDSVSMHPFVAWSLWNLFGSTYPLSFNLLFCRCHSFCQDARSNWQYECKRQAPEKKVFTNDLCRVSTKHRFHCGRVLKLLCIEFVFFRFSTFILRAVYTVIYAVGPWSRPDPTDETLFIFFFLVIPVLRLQPMLATPTIPALNAAGRIRWAYAIHAKIQVPFLTTPCFFRYRLMFSGALIRFWLRFTPEFQISVVILSSPVALAGAPYASCWCCARVHLCKTWVYWWSAAVALWGMLSLKHVRTYVHRNSASHSLH